MSSARRGGRPRVPRVLGTSRAGTWAARTRRDVRRRAPLSDLGPISDDEWSAASDDDPDLHRVTAPTSLGAEIARLAGRTGWAERLGAASVAARWSDIVGEELTGRCEPVRISGGVLVVRAESAVWATQLRYLQVQLAERASSVLGPGSVQEVRIVVGALEGPLDPASGWGQDTGSSAGAADRPDGPLAAEGGRVGHAGGRSAPDQSGTSPWSAGRRSAGRGRGRRGTQPPPPPSAPPPDEPPS